MGGGVDDVRAIGFKDGFEEASEAPVTSWKECDCMGGWGWCGALASPKAGFALLGNDGCPGK